jgi:hypothetical protein
MIAGSMVMIMRGLLSIVPVIVLVMLGFLLLCGTLTINITNERFSFWFGIGLIRFNYTIAEIAECVEATNPWWYGFGIHLTFDGWLYNVSGLDAVQITLKNGRKLRVGTDEPKELCNAMKSALSASRSR